MALLTAAELKDQEVAEFTFDLGGGKEVLLRKPDFQLLVLQGIIPMKLFTDVVKLVGDWVGASEVTEAISDSSDKLLSFVNPFVCACMVMPRVVMTEAERTVDALVVSDLTLATKKAIVVAVTSRVAAEPEVAAAAATFPAGGHGEGSGQDVQEVLPASV